MRLKTLALGFAVCVGFASAQASFADTLTLMSTSSETAGNDYVYPYNMSLNGSSATTPMMCINYNDEITTGETWQVQAQQISTSSSVQLQEDAFLFSKVATNGDLATQLDVWYILDSDAAANSGWNSTVEMNLVNMAQNAVPGLTNSFLNQYTILSPVVANQAGWTDGTPQSFIVNSSAVTPEPSSLLLLATGLSAASLLLMRRRAIQEQASGTL